MIESKTAKGHAFVFCDDISLAKSIVERIEMTFSHQVYIKHDFEKLLHSLTSMQNEDSVEFVVLDLDSISRSQFKRLYQLLNIKQIPCVITSNDHSQLHELTHELDDTFVSFIPKTIIKTMFNETLMLLLEKCTPQKKLSKRIKDFSLTRKPRSLYFLAFILCLEPLVKIFYLKATTGFGWDTLFRTLFSIEGVWPNFEFWFLFPLAGYALWSIKSWSFPFFICLQMYSVYSFATYEQFTWPYVAETPHLSSGILLFFNMLIIIYFMTPENRRPFWNKTQRIWRDSSRYATNIKSEIKDSSLSYETTITNLSKTGAYFTSRQDYKIGDKMLIQFQVSGKEMSVEAKIRRMQPTAHEEYNGYGVEFTSVPKEEKEYIKDYVSGLVHRLQ